VLSCGRKDLRSYFNRPPITEFLENCRELSTRAVENSRTLREKHETGYPILRLRLFCCRIFFGLSDHDSFKEIGPELKKVEKQNKNRRRRRPEGVAEAQEA
jgi:hypothetical protein